MIQSLPYDFSSEYSLSSEYTFHYQAQHIDFAADLNLTNATEFELIDQWNNTYFFDDSGTLSINDDLPLRFTEDDDWREVRFKEAPKRRRLFIFLAGLLAAGLFAHFFRYYAYHCNWFLRTFIGCREWREHPRRIPPNGGYAAFYWKRKRIQRGKYVGKNL